MAGTTAMSTYTRNIEWAVGHAWGKVTRRVNGASELYPGFLCTAQGHTFPDIAKPDAFGDSVLGVVGCGLDQDIDTVCSDNEEVPVYKTGSGWGVYAYKKGATGGAVVDGEIVCSSGVDDEGFFIGIGKAASQSSSTYATMIHEILGRSAETLASNTANLPCKIVLSV